MVDLDSQDPVIQGISNAFVKMLQGNISFCEKSMSFFLQAGMAQALKELIYEDQDSYIFEEMLKEALSRAIKEFLAGNICFNLKENG